MNFYLNKTALSNGIYTFKVYANDTSDNWNVSETRIVTITVAPSPTPPPVEVPAITPLSFLLALLSLFGLGAIAMRQIYKR